MALTTEFWADAPHGHVVQFYDLDHELAAVAATFRWSVRSPGQARRLVVDTLAAWECTNLIDPAALIVTELATNAVLHARTGFTVIVSRGPDGTVRIAVRDVSPVRPRRRRAGPLDSSGRGLRLVEALAVGWGAELFPDGKEVWAELGRTPSPACVTSVTDHR